MEPEGSLPDSQVPATCPYSEPVWSSPHPHIPLPEDPSYYYPPIYALVSQVASFPWVSPPKPCIRFSSLLYALHVPPIDFITRTILGEEYRSLCSSLCNFHHSLITTSLLGRNILNTLFPNTISLLFSLNLSDQVSHPYESHCVYFTIYIWQRSVMLLYTSFGTDSPWDWLKTLAETWRSVCYVW